MKLSLGPVQYYWPRVAMLQFYQAMCEAPVDTVYLGETVCSRRHELRLNDWLDVADMLTQAGKEVVLSTQVLIESRQELATLRNVAANGRYGVEANDMGAVRCLNGASFVAGPFLNIYNPPVLHLLHGQGARRWVMPLEMGRDGLAGMLDDKPGAMETEVFVYGRMPLAFSARCFTARHRNLPKDNCQYVCGDHPDGLMLRTREDASFLVLNGIQTQSAQVCNLIHAVPVLRQLGVEYLRISPQAEHTARIIQLFRDAVDARLSPDDAFTDMEPLMPAPACNGYWHNLPGRQWCVPGRLKEGAV